MATTARRQHTVSKFYLRGFADEGGRLRRTQVPGDRDILISVSKATVVKDFYSIDLPDGTISDYFERLLARVESGAADALDDLQRGTWPLLGRHRVALASWIALQHLRGEYERESISRQSGETIRILVGISGKEALREHIARAEGRSISDIELDAEWNDLTKPGGPTLSPDKKQHIRLVMDLVPGMASYLAESHWTLYRFERRSLATSDHPVAMVVDDDYPVGMGIGIYTADLFTVPLSRRLALSIQPRRRLEIHTSDTDSVPDFDVQGTTSIANSINQQTVWNSRRYVFGHPEDSLDPRVRFPEADRHAHLSSSDHWIFEEGFLSEIGTSAFSHPGPDTGKSFSLADLPWPIPGRVHPVD